MHPARWLGVSVMLAPALLTAAGPTHAQAPPQGTFFASRNCPAYRSFVKGTNPGNVQVVPDHSYQVVAGNKPEPTQYWIIVPGADPERRWVSIACGTFTANNGISTPPHTAPEPTGDRLEGRFKTQYVFAISWEPAFCQTDPGKPECRDDVADAPQSHRFSLHGLWPDPREYCNVAPAEIAQDKEGRWSALPAVVLEPETQRTLDADMPGTRSFLERHEWIRHGTCSGLSQEAYFQTSTYLLETINASSLRDLFERRTGQTLTLDDVREAANAAFGPGSGQRVRMSCVKSGDRTLISELTIGLTGQIGPDSDVSDLILAAAPTKGGCGSGIVDLPGLQ